MAIQRDPRTCELRNDHRAGCREHGALLADCEGCPEVREPEVGVLHLRGVRRDVQRQLRLEALLKGTTMGDVLNEILTRRYEGALEKKHRYGAGLGGGHGQEG